MICHDLKHGLAGLKTAARSGGRCSVQSWQRRSSVIAVAITDIVGIDVRLVAIVIFIVIVRRTVE